MVLKGLKEKLVLSRAERGKQEMKGAKEIIGEVDDSMEAGEEIEEIYRLGNYEQEQHRPMCLFLPSLVHTLNTKPNPRRPRRFL